jgi:heme-degrading monooxygenase HmoA
MIVRVWTTDVAPGREEDYLQFANSASLEMFLDQPGCLGVLFLRGAEPAHAVCSFWSDAAAVDAFNRSARYAATVSDILATGALAGVQTVMTWEVEGGDVTPLFNTAVPPRPPRT